MKIYRILLASMLCLITAFLSGCRAINGLSSENTELKIGVEGLSGNYNPFYAENEADNEVVSQMFRKIQIRASDNSLINHGGSISYEFVGEKQVKYTVSINDDMKFSDGTHITIDDVIFFYHFIADASYDGIYRDWYLNDIEGLKEYYYDDINYQKSVADIEKTVAEKYTSSTISADDLTTYLIKTRLEGKFESADSIHSSGKSWKDYISSLGYTEEINALGNNPTDEDWLKLIASVEAENNFAEYNPEEWYRNNLYENYLKSNYLDEIKVNEISGIKKINDYTCSILFNSRNINAISEINALLVPKDAYSAEYVKGSAETVKDKQWLSVGSGPYIITDSSEDTVKMSHNDFYLDEECGFKSIKLIDIEKKEYDPIDSVTSGKLDVVKTNATLTSINKLKDSPVQYTINNCDYYVSMFYNTATLDYDSRKALMGICDLNNTVDTAVGSYYTRVLNPLSIRFPEYSSQTKEPFYSPDTYSFYTKLNDSPVKNLTAYYCGKENDMEYSLLTAYQKILSDNGVTLNIVIADNEEYNNAISSGKADLWIERVYDGVTCDKYEYFNSEGLLNKAGISSDEIDELTRSIRSAVGFTDKSAITSKLMLLVMQQAVEWPLYQFQELTVYNTEKINPDSFSQNNKSDGFTYFIPKLKPND